MTRDEARAALCRAFAPLATDTARADAALGILWPEVERMRDQAPDSVVGRLRASGAVVVDPLRRCGRPVLPGTGFMLSTLLAEIAEGRTAAEVAVDFGLEPGKVGDALNALALSLESVRAEP